MGYADSLREHLKKKTDLPKWNFSYFKPEVSRVSSASEMQPYRSASSNHVIASWLHDEGNTLPFSHWSLLSWIAPAACVLLAYIEKPDLRLSIRTLTNPKLIDWYTWNLAFHINTKTYQAVYFSFMSVNYNENFTRKPIWNSFYLSSTATVQKIA